MRRLIATVALLALAACGGGGGGGGSNGTGPTSAAPTPPEAARFLTQATFGPTQPSVDALNRSSINAWIDQQTRTPSAMSHLTYLDQRLAQLRQTDPNASLGREHFYEAWWRHVGTGEDQLRQRMAFALSQIFVISIASDDIDIRGAGSYYDMLLTNAFGNFRTLLEDVTLHPMMGRYLTYLANQKEDTNGTRTPDENYAREVMQLFTIGVSELNPDGTVRRDAQNQPIPTYTSADIAGLAKVFTGISWYHPTPTNSTFFGGSADPQRNVRPMIFYNNYHSTSAKAFLGTTIPASTTVNVSGDLRIALDRLAEHPNVGPFIAQRLIQQFVTSNPSPAYVGRVAAVFNNNGSGTRGDLAAVIRAVLIDAEAREAASASAATYGKLREPVIRLANWIRAFGATSTSGNWRVNSTSSNQSLGQSPLASASVFNFWRPGFTPPGTTEMGQRNLLAPEFQIVDEVSVAGYVNTMQSAIDAGIGNNRDVIANYNDLLTLADNGGNLVDRVNLLLVANGMSSSFRQRVLDAVNAIAIPAAGSAQTQIDAARRNRIKTAILLTMASPEYLIQR
jgi:uncharacterized protein (DUF1800 family)